MLHSTPHQRHGVYQRPTRLSLEVSERELLGGTAVTPTMRHLPHTVTPTALTVKARSPQHCPVVQPQNAQVPQMAAIAYQCELLQAAVEVNPLGQIHVNHIRQTLTRRLQAACDRGDQALVKLLQQEELQFA